MSRFKRIKNTSTKKSSVSIDEKINLLNKELEKTGMLSERMTTSNVYSRSKYIPAQDAVVSPVPDGNGLVDGTWTQPVGTAFGGGVADAIPTSFPKIWNNAGYRTPVSGIVNTDNLNGDGAALPIAKMPNNGEQVAFNALPQAVRDAGAVGGFMKYNAGVNAGWRSGYMTGGTRDSGGGAFTSYDDQTFGIKYPINHLGVDVTPTSHPHLFRAVQYWHPFSIFNPDIDAYWPGGDQSPKYGGVVAEINGIKYALFTAYKWIGDGGNTYLSQDAKPASTILIQRRGIGDINYHGPITPGGMFGLSKQGFGYIDNRSRKSGRGAQRLIGGPIYRKAGSGGVRRGVTSMSGGVISLGRGGKVSSRGVGSYIRGKGVGFSPSAGRVATTVAKKLPPKPTPAEIRNETVKKFRENGDNLAANRFYTEDRISELESKDNLTSTEQNELDQLKVNAVHMNQVSPPPEQVMTQAQEAKEEIYNDKSEIKPETTFEKIINDGGLLPKLPGALKNLFESYKTGELGLSILANKGLLTGKTPYEKIDYMADQIDKANTALNDLIDKFVPEATQKNVDAAINTFFDNIVDNVIEPEMGDMSVASNMLQTYDKVLNDPNYDGSPIDFTTKFSKADIEAMKTIGSKNPDPNSTGKTPNQLKEEYLATDDLEKKAALKEKIQKQLNENINWWSNSGRPNSLGNTLGNGTNIDVDKFINDNIIKGNDNYQFNPIEDYKLTDAHRILARMLGVSTDTLPMGGGEMTVLAPLAAKLLLRVPDDGTNRSWTENLEGEGGKAMAFSFEFSADEDAENPGFEPQKNIIEKGKDAVKSVLDKVKDLFNKDKSAKANADKYPPPKQSSIFADEDGILSKYYTKSIFTGKDGKTYKSVLYLPYTGDNDDGSPRFGSLYHPSAYNFNIPLFDTPMDEPLGDYVPPDDLPDIPFTPPEEPDNRKDYEKNRDRQRRFRNSYEPKGDVLSEAAKLGHFEPEELNVDIEKLRKGIMPEFPKKSPKIIDGYHQDSKLKPKEPSKDVYLKLDPKDLIRNHRLKQKEADEMMKTIDRINAHIEEHPEDLIHAQMRYPIDDPRLAELNWKMDQMLEAGEEYLDSNFKENQTLYKRATDRVKNNVKLTDPEYVQKHYDELRGTTKPKKTKLVGRLGKHLNKYESKSLFKHVNSKDFKKISERKLEKEKFLEKQEQERLDYINDINAEMDEFRSDWRNELKEQPAFKAVPIDTAKMTSSQSFAIFPNFPGSSDTGIRLDLDGGLGRDNSLASTDLGLGDPNFTGIFQFPSEGGGFVPAISFKAGGEINSAQISYGDFPLSGYAMPLGGEMYRSITQRKKEDINKELDSSEEYTKQIKADALMKARVGDGPAVVKIYKASDFTPGEGLANTYSPEQLQKLSVENPQKFSEYKHISDIADEMTKKVETSFEKIDQEYSNQWEPKLSSLLPSNQYSDLYKKHGGSAFNEVNIEINRLNYEEYKAMTRVKTKDGIKLRSNKKSNAIRATANKISDAIPILQELQNKLDDIRQSKMDVVETENRREMKALQKAAPKFFFPHGELKPLDLYMEPFGADLKTMNDIEKYAPEPTTKSMTGNEVNNLDNKQINTAVKDVGGSFGPNIGTGFKIFGDFLTKGHNDRFVADRKYLGKEYMNRQFFPNVSFDRNGTYVKKDVVVGSGQPAKYNENTGMIEIRATFDFKTNAQEVAGAIASEKGEKADWANRFNRTGSKYALDATVDPLPGVLKPLSGIIASHLISTAKFFGKGNLIPIVIKVAPEELKLKNKKAYDELVELGVIPKDK